MRSSLEFILGQLDRYSPAHVAAEDLAGVHGPALACWRRLGFLAREPERNPVPSCPHCRGGIPYQVGRRFVCGACHSTVDGAHLHLWRFDLETLLAWLARRLKLSGSARQIDERLWNLGCLAEQELFWECFFRRSGPLSERGRQRLLAYRNALLLCPLPSAEPPAGFAGPCLSLLEILRQEKNSLRVTDLARVLHGAGAVRFDGQSGALWAGDQVLGHVPVESTEYHLLACLSRHLNEFVSYADMKHYVLQNSGSRDTTEEATFCQRLKSRIKKRVPKIDDFIVTTNKGRGYQLRGQIGR